jgi:hypothetical protein
LHFLRSCDNRRQIIWIIRCFAKLAEAIIKPNRIRN